MPGKDTNTGAKRAREAREAFGLGEARPVECLLTTVEETAGHPVVVARLPEEVAGCCVRVGEEAVLWVNGAQSLARQRFTLAHELGHLRGRHEASVAIDSPEILAGLTHDPNEVQANAFAAEFLAPRLGIEALVGAHEPDLEAVVGLAAHFGVSTIAALFRLSTLGLTSRVDRLRQEIEEGLADQLWLALARRRRTTSSPASASFPGSPPGWSALRSPPCSTGARRSWPPRAWLGRTPRPSTPGWP